MFNLTEIWNHATPKVKLLFWFTMALYVSILLVMFVIIGYEQGYIATWATVQTRLPYLLKFFAIWPTSPLLIVVYLDGLYNYKREINNPENMAA